MSDRDLMSGKTLRGVDLCFLVLAGLLIICVNRATAAALKCKDGPLCSYMASEGECEADPEYMLTECPRACRNPCLCDVSAFTNDTACDCLIRAKDAGYCNTSQALVECSTTCSSVTHESCPLLPLPADPNARLSTWSTHYQVTVTEVCIPGYLPKVDRNQGKKVCSTQGRWVQDFVNGDPVECIGVDCGSPPTTANTYSVATDTGFGSTVDYACDRGCVPESGQKTLVCNASGLWEGEPLTCRRVDCGLPPSSPNATITVTNTTLGGVATYSCVPGYTYAQGSTTLHCDTSGIWHGSLLMCKVIDCNDPPSLPNTHIQVSGTTFNQSANYSCVPGFEYEHGQSNLICGPTGNWTGDPLKCKTSQKPPTPVTSDPATDVLIPLLVGVSVFIIFIIVLIIFIFMNMEAFSKNKKLTKAANTFRKSVKSIFNFQIWITDSHKPNTEAPNGLHPHALRTQSVTSPVKPLVSVQVKDSKNFHSVDRPSNTKVRDTGVFHSTMAANSIKSSSPPVFTNFLSPTSALVKPPSTNSMSRSLSSITVSSLSQRTTPEGLPQVTS